MSIKIKLKLNSPGFIWPPKYIYIIFTLSKYDISTQKARNLLYNRYLASISKFIQNIITNIIVLCPLHVTFLSPPRSLFISVHHSHCPIIGNPGVKVLDRNKITVINLILRNIRSQQIFSVLEGIHSHQTFSVCVTIQFVSPDKS